MPTGLSEAKRTASNSLVYVQSSSRIIVNSLHSGCVPDIRTSRSSSAFELDIAPWKSWLPCIVRHRLFLDRLRY